MEQLLVVMHNRPVPREAPDPAPRASRDDREDIVSRIAYIAPVRVDPADSGDVSPGIVRAGNELRQIGFSVGPHHLEYHYYEALVVPDILPSVAEFERQGYDAAVIGCFYDLGLPEARELASRLVVTAPCESSVLLAASLGHRFSILVGRRKWVPQMEDTVRRYGLHTRLASLRPIDLGVPDYHTDEEETHARFVKAGRAAIAQDGAEVLILGCTASVGFSEQLQADLGVPVIDSAAIAVKHAEHLIELRNLFGLTHSKVGAYEAPPPGELNDWRLQDQYGLPAASERWVDLR